MVTLSNPHGIQITHCLICESMSHEKLFARNGCQIHRCQDCGFTFLNPQPPDAVLENIYSDEYFLGSAEPEVEDQVARMKRGTAAQYMDAIRQYSGISSGRLLEVGCGKGELLLEAHTRGFDVQGVEVSAQAVRIANERIGKEVVSAETLERIALPSASYDVCVCADVIEHMRDPITLLAEVQRVLKPDGVLFLVTPSKESRLARVMKRTWVEFKLEHLFYFDPNTLANALARTGFHSVDIRPNRKVLTFDYVCRHFERYPVPRLSRILTWLHFLTPAMLSKKHFSVYTGSISALARAGMPRPRPLLSVIVPVYNEHPTFIRMMDAVLSKKLKDVDKEIIIVEGNSSDGTREDVLRYQGRPGIKIVLLERARGKGHAVRTGLSLATGDFILIQDADLEYDVNDYDELLEPLRTYRRAFVLGSRHIEDGKIRKFADQPVAARVLNFGHIFFRTLFNLLYSQRLKDPFTMYKVFHRDCLHGIRLECDRFDFDIELLAKLIRKGFVPVEIPVNYRSRSFKEGKKVNKVFDPWTWIWACLKYRVVSPYKPTRGMLG